MKYIFMTDMRAARLAVVRSDAGGEDSAVDEDSALAEDSAVDEEHANEEDNENEIREPRRPVAALLDATREVLEDTADRDESDRLVTVDEGDVTVAADGHHVERTR